MPDQRDQIIFFVFNPNRINLKIWLHGPQWNEGGYNLRCFFFFAILKFHCYLNYEGKQDNWSQVYIHCNFSKDSIYKWRETERKLKKLDLKISSLSDLILCKFWEARRLGKNPSPRWDLNSWPSGILWDALPLSYWRLCGKQGSNCERPTRPRRVVSSNSIWDSDFFQVCVS